MLIRMAQSVGEGIAQMIGSLFEEERGHIYHAAFGDPGEYLSRFNHGFAVTGSKALTRELSHTNCALFGPTGSGKSSTVIINSAISLARKRATIIFNDVSGELWEYTSGYLARKGYVVLRLNFSDPLHSESFNPLLYCFSISDIQKLALLIIRNSIGESKSDPFWENSAMMLLSLMARYLVFHAVPEHRTMQNVLRLVEKFAVGGEDQSIDRLFVRTGDEELLAAYKATVVMGEKTLQSVISTLRTALSLWMDPAVCSTTARNTIDLGMLRAKPVAIYMNTPLKDLLYYKPISALFIQTLFNHVLSRIPKRDERSIFFLLDEFATYRFPSISTVVSNIRKFNAGLLLCMQDEMSLISQYGPAQAHEVKTNCGCQVYLKGQPLHTCRELSQILGKYTYTDEKGIERSRELLTPDEIRMTEEAIILINNAPPLLCKTVPHFQNIWMSSLTSLPPYEVPEKGIITPPLIPIE